MSLSLPADPPAPGASPVSFPRSSRRSRVGRSGSRRPRSAVVFVVDGLGARNLAARSGHARFLAASGGEEGRRPHGLPLDDGRRADLPADRRAIPASTDMVGYRVRIPGTDEASEPAQGLGDRRARPALLAARAADLRARVRRGPPVLRRVPREYAGIGLHRGDPARARVRRRRRPRRAVRGRGRPRGAASRARSCTSTHPSSTRIGHSAAGSPTSGPPRWRAVDAAARRSRRRSPAAPGPW